MKKGLFFVTILLYTTVSAQIMHPVHWSYAAKKISKKEAVVLIKATIDNGWHIYSVNQVDGGPQKTNFEFTPSKAFRLQDNIIEPHPVAKYEKSFAMDVHYFEKSVIFKQKVMLTSSDAVVRGKVSFMACNDQKCLSPDDVVFTIRIK